MKVFHGDKKENNDSGTQGNVRADSDRGLQLRGSAATRSEATRSEATTKYGERSDQKRSVAPLGSKKGGLDLVQSERKLFGRVATPPSTITLPQKVET